MPSRNAAVGILLGTLVLLGALVWIFRSPETPGPPPQQVTATAPSAAAPEGPASPSTPRASTSSPAAAPAPDSTKPQPATVGATRPAPPAVNTHPPANLTATREVLEHVQFTIRDFRLSVGENPVGDNAEITRALLGDNRKQARFGIPDGSTVNAAGELCDPWGTPYFFHALARDHMEIRSAGPDQKMWTADDIQQ